MKTFLLAGHGGFENRGCEAIVRTTVELLRQQFPECRVVLSSFAADRDRRSPAARTLEVVPATFGRFSPPWALRQIGRALRAKWTWKCTLYPIWGPVRRSDAVLSVGGDNYTVDYSSRPNYYLWINRLARESGKPIIVWGASIGPFPDANVREAVLGELAKADLITVRETVTRDYLAEHGVAENVRLVADPAFLLKPEEVDVSEFWPEGERVLGLNVSPLLARYRGEQSAPQSVVDAALALIRHAVQAGMGVLLIPHVTGRPDRDDHAFMEPLVDLSERPGRVRLTPPALDAAQTKYVISQCRAFVGARTHSTIAALSSGVPTLSIAYSQKAVGINRDIFGHLRHVADVRSMTGEQLVGALDDLLAEEGQVREHLRQSLPEIREKARAGVQHLADVLESRGQGSPNG